MPERYLFDLPVYRIQQDRYDGQRASDVEAQLDKMRQSVAGFEPSEATKLRIQEHQYQTYGPWIFNEIIGYIRLHFLGNQVRGEYFSAEKKRNPISRHKVFTYRTWKLAPEVTIWGKSPTNDEIFAAVREYVRDCRAELQRDRYIDDEILERLGPHLDWQQLFRPGA